MPVTISSPLGLAAELGRRLRAQRLDREWTREELGARAQVAVETLKKFERTGQISLPRLVRLVAALGLAGELEKLFLPTQQPSSLRELEQRARQRQRGRRAAAKPRSGTTQP